MPPLLLPSPADLIQIALLGLIWLRLGQSRAPRPRATLDGKTHPLVSLARQGQGGPHG